MGTPHLMVGKGERVTLDLLQKHFHLPMAEVAKKFNVCVTFFKRICRSRGIRKWPYRKLKSLHKASQLKQIQETSSRIWVDHELQIGSGVEAADVNTSMRAVLHQPTLSGTSLSSYKSAVELQARSMPIEKKEHDKPAQDRALCGIDILAFVASSAMKEERQSQRRHRYAEQDQPQSVQASAVPESVWHLPSNVTHKDLLPSLLQNVSSLPCQPFCSNTPLLNFPHHSYIGDGMQQQAQQVALQSLQWIYARNDSFLPSLYVDT